MLRNALRLSPVLALLITAGCIEATTVALVRKDGSGVVVEAVYLGKAFQRMMEQMAIGLGAGGAEAAESKKPFKLPMEIDKYKTRAKKMGEGVKFLSANEISGKDGSSGVRVVYGFEDVRKLRLSSEPQTPKAGGAAGMPGAGSKGKPITFDFEPGEIAKLVIHMPHQEKAEPGDSVAADVAMELADMPDAGKTPPPEQLAAVRQMFEGLRVRVMVKVDGELLETNAAFVEQSSKAGRKQYVTLLDMNIGEVIKDEQAFKKMMAMGQAKDMASAMELYKGTQGLRIEPAERVEVSFK